MSSFSTDISISSEIKLCDQNVPVIIIKLNNENNCKLPIDYSICLSWPGNSVDRMTQKGHQQESTMLMGHDPTVAYHP